MAAVRPIVSNISITSAYSGLSLAARRWQSEPSPSTKGEPQRILALHGWLDNSASFDPLAEAIFSSGQCHGELVALDFPGHGHSEWRPGDRSHYVYPEYVGDIVGVLAALEWDQDVVLIGHSMGGGLALAATAVLGRERISRTLLIEGLGPVSSPAEETTKNLREAVFGNLQFFKRGGHLHRSFPTAEDAFEARKHATPYMSDRACRLIVDRDREKQPDSPAEAGVYLSKDPTVKLRSLFRYTEDAVLDMIRSVQSPVMLLAGTAPWMEKFILQENAIVRERVLKETGFLHSSIRIENGHHHLHMEEETLGQALPHILAFLSSSQ